MRFGNMRSLWAGRRIGSSSSIPISASPELRQPTGKDSGAWLPRSASDVPASSSGLRCPGWRETQWIGIDLLEICALADTLILDEDGVYDPAHFNDRLLLGLKGTMSEAELHVLRARLQGGILNKARVANCLYARQSASLTMRSDAWGWILTGRFSTRFVCCLRHSSELARRWRR